SDAEVTIQERFVYDDQKRLLKHYHKVNSQIEELLAENTYNDLGQLINKKTGNTTGTPLQSIDQTYNIRGWLTKVNDPASLNGKLFAYELKYQNPVYSTVSTGKYNGNIAEIDWSSADTGTFRRYNYQYDALDRLKNGIYSEPNATVPQNDYYNESITYDFNGNIQTLKRNRVLTGFGTQLIDDLTYTYIGNRVNTVSDASSNYAGYPASVSTAIPYDGNGNMISHEDRGILQIDYNYLNLPNSIKFNRLYNSHDFVNTSNFNTKYLYNAAGIKLRKVYTYGTGRAQIEAVSKTDYLDGFQYTNDVLSFVPTSEGYYDFVQNKYIYHYTDQVGNIRVAYYKDASGNLKIDRTTNFYPFGLEFGGDLSTANSISPNYKYSSQGQEKQTETGWSSYHWRNYDASMARFFNIDPLSEKYAYQSHYNFSENRVVDGRELEGLEFVPLPIFAPGAVAPPPPFAAKPGAGSAVYEQMKSNAINNYNGLMRGLGTQINVLAAISYTGIILANRVLNSEGDNKRKSKDGDSSTGKKKTGSYTNTHQSGKKYHGKGDEKRAAKSGKEKTEKNDDPLEKTDWTEAKNDREAFKQESERMETDADKDKGVPGHKSENNYNQRRSPGDRYREQDAKKYNNKQL
ncbi:MAG: hypothetical protein ACN6N7_12635, partial [Chryseobacterium culicis]